MNREVRKLFRQDRARIAAPRNVHGLCQVESSSEVPRHLARRTLWRVQCKALVTPRSRPRAGIRNQSAAHACALACRIDRELMNARRCQISIGLDGGRAIGVLQSDGSDHLSPGDCDEALSTLDAIARQGGRLLGALAFDAAVRQILEGSM